SGYTSLAIDAEEIPLNTFYNYKPNDPRVTAVGEWIKTTMKKVDGPGYVSAWQNSQPAGQWWMSSYDSITFDPALYQESGGHVHLNFGFTAPGIYKVTFEVSAHLSANGLPVYSDEVTLTFGVETTGDGALPPGLSRLPADAVKAGIATVGWNGGEVSPLPVEPPLNPAGCRGLFASPNQPEQPIAFRPATHTLGQQEEWLVDATHDGDL